MIFIVKLPEGTPKSHEIYREDLLRLHPDESTNFSSRGWVRVLGVPSALGSRERVELITMVPITMNWIKPLYNYGYWYYFFSWKKLFIY